MSTEILTQERLKELLHYDPDTGVFTWKVTRCRAKKGASPKCISMGYIAIGIDTKTYRAHRLAFLYQNGCFPSEQVDHINHERSDNRWSNLRLASHMDNCRNTSLSKNNTSGVLGVHWNNKDSVWMAQIGEKGKTKHLGCFKTKSEAATARKQADIEYGYHGNHGVAL